MIAEDKQDDLSMEDILSSIKDILDNEVQGKVEEEVIVSAPQSPIAPVQPDITTSEDELEEDEVFDLSSDMIIDDKELEALNLEADNFNFDDLAGAAEHINLDDIIIEEAEDEVVDFSPASPTIEAEPEFVIPEIDDLPSLDDLNNMDFDWEDEPVVAWDEKPEDSVAVTDKETIIEAEPFIESELAYEIEEPTVIIPEIEPEPVDIVSETGIAVATDELVEDRSDSPFLNNEDDVESEPIFSIEDDAAVAASEALDENTLAVEDLMMAESFEETPEPEPIIEVEPEPEVLASGEIDEILSSASELIEADAEEEAQAQAQAQESNAVDASADIINNFARMFAAQSDKSETTPEVTQPKVTEVAPAVMVAPSGMGDGSKTIEQVVSDVIKQIIGSAVSAKFNSDSNIDTYAREEIRTQTQAWLDKNLTSVVEKAVQKEIERVMAKVGK